jgi:hypothetical protein
MAAISDDGRSDVLRPRDVVEAECGTLTILVGGSAAHVEPAGL